MISAESRIPRVVALLVGLGALFGAACAAASVGALLVFRGGPSSLVERATWTFLSLSAEFGAVTGAILGPLTGWILLRHVPLGRAIAWTASGTIAGAMIGELAFPFNPYVRTIPALFLGGVAGFVLGGIAVRLRTPRPKRAEIVERAG